MSAQTEDLSQNLTTPIQNSPDAVQGIRLALDKLTHKTQETAKELRELQKHGKKIAKQREECSKRLAPLPQTTTSDSPEVTAKLRQEQENFYKFVDREVANSIRLRTLIIDQHQRTFVELGELQTRILDFELIRWQRGQQLAKNGVPFENNLDQIQEWCESLADIIIKNRQQISEMETFCTENQSYIPSDTLTELRTLRTHITSLLCSLVTNTFIVEKQPPQVIKTRTKFYATVRLLLGSKLKVFRTHPEVKVTITNEVEARVLADNVRPKASGYILNSLRTMQYHKATKKVSAGFSKLQLSQIKRAEKNGTVSVTDEKFSLLFQTQFEVRDIELAFHMCAISLPVIVIDRVNQIPHARATVTWDNAFAEPGRVPFHVPEKVSWKAMADVLRNKFKAVTGCELKPDDLQFLACKVFGSAQAHDDSRCLTWSQFGKERLPKRNFTFWEWFHAVMETTRDHLRNLWNDGLILGFVARQQAEDMLLKRCNGTFLLRFSDSVPGGISIAFVADLQQRGRRVFTLQPHTRLDLAIRSMADSVDDLKMLLFLYPDVPKDQAFRKYYSPYEECSNGYMQWVFRVQLSLTIGCESEQLPTPDRPAVT